MAIAESAASLGPRLAPDDPTLAKPWKGLIDGTTGLLYYWNPETNVTQYERPASAAPPLPPGPPPSASTSKLAPIPAAHSMPENGTITQQPGQQMQQPQPSQQLPLQQPGQQMPLQLAQKMPYQQIQMQNQQIQQVSPQQGQPYPNSQLEQMPYSQVSYLPGQLMMHSQGQPQQGLQNAQHQGQDALGSQAHHHGQQPQASQVVLHQGQQAQVPQTTSQHGQQLQGLQAAIQKGPQSHGLQTMIQHLQGQQQREPLMVHQQTQQPPGQQIAYPHSQQIGSLRAEEKTHQELKQVGYTSPLVQQAGAFSSSHNPPGSLGPQVQGPHMGVNTFQRPQPNFSGFPSVGTQSSNAAPNQLQQEGIDTMLQQQQIGGPTNMIPMGHAPFRPPMGMKMGYEEDVHRKVGADFYPSGNSETPMMLHQQPKLAGPPLSWNQQQDMRRGPISPQFPANEQSGGLNMTKSRAMPNMYGHAPFPNASPVRPPPRIFGQSDLPGMSSVDAYRQHHEVTALGDNVPAPFMTFEATGFPPEILKEMHFAGFSSPTPIQAQTWPIALQNRDIVAIAKTGSGKTLGYLIPAFVHLRRCRNSHQSGPTVLVLAPTRELATQIHEEAIKFGRSSRVSCICLYGGSPKGPQLREIERGADIVVATPGRLNDFLEMKKINFRQISFLVLDEADRMLDMGFEPQIRKIVDEIPPRRQTLMYTATWPKEVRMIAADLLVNPVQVNIGNVDELVANKSITQFVEVVPPMERQRRLEQILRSQERGSKIIIFCSTKRMCDQLAHSIGRSFGAAAIHGDKSQDERDRVLGHFRSGRAPVLVATDVAARGLDIKDIRVVINYDFPTGIEEYIHRIGRTGRAGATGVAYTFFSDQDWKYAADLVKVLEGANQFVPPVIREMAERGRPIYPRGRGEVGRFDSGAGGRWESGAGRAGRGSVGSSFGGRAGGRNDTFGGRAGGRNETFGGRGGRGRGLSGPSGSGSWGRNDRGLHDRHNNFDGRSRYDNRRGIGDRSGDRRYSPSPERVRSWGYDRSRSQSSRSRSRSSRSRSCSRSWSRSRSRSRSRSIDRIDRPRRRPSMFDAPLAAPGQELSAPLGFVAPIPAAAPARYEVPVLPGFDASQMSPMSPGQDTGAFPEMNHAVESGIARLPDSGAADPGLHPSTNNL